MGYSMRNGRWADTEPVTLLGDGTRTTSFGGPPVELGDRTTLRLTLVVTSAEAESFLHVTIETAEEREGPWRVVGSFAEHAAPAVERAAFGPLDRWARARSEVKGAVGFHIVGEAAQVLYATADDFRELALPAPALVGVPEGGILRALGAASARASSYLKQRYALPLVGWGDDLRLAVVSLAAWTVLCRRGFNPEAGADTAIRENRKDAIEWLRGVARGELEPADIEDSSPPVLEDAAVVLTEPRRGW